MNIGSAAPSACVRKRLYCTCTQAPDSHRSPRAAAHSTASAASESGGLSWSPTDVEELPLETLVERLVDCFKQEVNRARAQVAELQLQVRSIFVATATASQLSHSFPCLCPAPLQLRASGLPPTLS